MRDIVYIRVSTPHQAKTGSSLDHQDQMLLDWSCANGGEVVQSFVERGRSGRSIAKRPQFQAALAALQPGMRLVVSRLTRLGRNAREILNVAHQIGEIGAHIVITQQQVDTSTALGKCWFTILAGFAQLESNNLSEHMLEMVDFQRERGFVWGRTPFGWGRDGKRLVPNVEEREVWCVVKAHAREGLNALESAQRLAALGAKNRHGRPFSRHHIYQIRLLDFADNPTFYNPPDHYSQRRKYV